MAAIGVHGKNESFKEHKTSADTFGVKHFAGEVTYKVTDFLTKNKDPVSQDLLVLMQFSESPFVANVMSQSSAAASAGKLSAKGASKIKSGKFVGVVDHFQLSLRSLVTTLQVS